MWPGFKSRGQHNMWALSLLLVLACSERFFSGYSCFPLSSKTNIFNFQFDQESGRQRSHFADVLPLNHYTFLFIIIFICSSTSDPPKQETVRGRNVGSFSEQRLIIEPTSDLLSKSYYELYSQFRWLLSNVVNIWTAPDFREFAFEQLNSFN